MSAVAATTGFQLADTSSLRRNPPQALQWVPILCGWLMMTFTFSFDAQGSPAVALDPLASQFKLLTRLMASAGLAVLVAWKTVGSGLARELLLFLPLCLFTAFAACSTWWSALKETTLSQSFSLGVLVLLGIACATTCHRVADASRLLKFLSLGLGLLCTGLLLLRLGIPSLAVADRNGTGLFHATNVAATASLMFLLVLTSRMVYGWNWSRWLLLPSAGLAAALLILSANRLSLGLTLVLGALTVAAYINRAVLAAAVLLCSLSGGLLLAVDPGMELAGSLGAEVTTFAARDQSVRELSEFSGREEMWNAVWTSFLESPWIGHGYFVTSADGELEVWYDSGNFTAHNLLLQSLATTGIVGTGLLLLGILLPILFTAFRLLLRPDARNLLLILIPVGLWYLGWSLLNESILGPLQPESVVFFSLLGMATGIALHSGPNTPRPVPAAGGQR